MLPADPEAHVEAVLWVAMQAVFPKVASRVRVTVPTSPLLDIAFLYSKKLSKSISIVVIQFPQTINQLLVLC